MSLGILQMLAFSVYLCLMCASWCVQYGEIKKLLSPEMCPHGSPTRRAFAAPRTFADESARPQMSTLPQPNTSVLNHTFAHPLDLTALSLDSAQLPAESVNSWEVRGADAAQQLPTSVFGNTSWLKAFSHVLCVLSCWKTIFHHLRPTELVRIIL